MKDHKLRLGRIIASILIIIISFVSAINIQPKVIGDPASGKNLVGLKEFETVNQVKQPNDEEISVVSNHWLSSSYNYTQSSIVLNLISISLNKINNLGAFREIFNVNLRK